MKRNIFLSLTLIALAACPLALVFAAGEVAIYTGEVGWITKEGADKQAQICIDRLNAAGIPNILFDSEGDTDALANWMKNATGNGRVDVCILYGDFPSSIYPAGNALPDGSIAEAFIESTDGDAFINHADWMFWGAGKNTQGGLQNMMDIAGITMWGNNTPMTVTEAGKTIAPSLTDFVSHRPFHVDELAGDWEVEAVLARNHDGTRADPIIVRDGNRGRLIPIMQTVGDDNPQGAVAAEVISYLMSKTLNTTERFPPEDVNQDAGVSIADPINEVQVTGQQQEHPIVRLIYFLPNDRAPQPDIDVKMDQLIKDAQHVYANLMEAHGFGRKTFQIETDASGKAVVHHVKGRYPDEHYNNLSYTWDIWKEIDGRFDTSKNIYLTVIDISSEVLNNGKAGGLGNATGGAGGQVIIPASGNLFNFHVAAHELGHAFGLQHDFRFRGDVKRLLADTPDLMITSFCAAEWLDAHRAFNTDQSATNEWPTIEMLPPSLVSPPNVIRLRFKVTGDGIHQVQLITLEDDGDSSLLGCKRLNGNSNHTVEFITTALTPNSRYVSLQMIDGHGNLFSSGNYPINVTSVMPPTEAVSIPDANLAAAVQREIGNSITTHTLLDLKVLQVPNSEITNLTGLEHAHNLRKLNLNLNLAHIGREHVNNNKILNFSPIVGLTQLTQLHLGSCAISDVSFLSSMTQLRTLELHNNPISDISPLTELTQLISLNLSNTPVSDVSPLAAMTRLSHLNLTGNNISDISPLAKLTQLFYLYLWDNAISDISPVANLTQLIYLDLPSNNISDISALSDLTQLRHLNLNSNAILDVSPLVGLDLPGMRWDSTGLSIEGNPLNYASIHTHIPAMQAKGVEVKFDNRAHSALAKISGDTQDGEANTTLANPFVVEALDEHGVPITGLDVTFRIIEGNGKLSATTATTDANGKAQTTLILGPNPGVIKVRVAAAEITYPVTFTATATKASRHAADVNGDGAVNIQDLVLVSSSFGQTGENAADVNGDGVVNISDLVLVAGAFGEGAAAAPTLHASDIDGLTAAEIQGMLTQARQMALTDPAYLRGIAVLEQLLDFLLPKETVLLANYPNPFNPETWIPYRLAKPADVKLRIHAVDGTLIRTLLLGHKAIGTYQIRNRAVYWDGKNKVGEPVASGVYFYTLTAGDFNATRKMLIRK